MSLGAFICVACGVRQPFDTVAEGRALGEAHHQYHLDLEEISE